MGTIVLTVPGCSLPTGFNLTQETLEGVEFHICAFVCDGIQAAQVSFGILK